MKVLARDGSLEEAHVEREALIKTMKSILGPEGVISEREQLRSYECDGLMNYRVIPDLVVLPESAEQVQQIVKTCYDEGIPFVARGSGTSPGPLFVTSTRSRSPARRARSSSAAPTPPWTIALVTTSLTISAASCS